MNEIKEDMARSNDLSKEALKVHIYDSHDAIVKYYTDFINDFTKQIERVCNTDFKRPSDVDKEIMKIEKSMHMRYKHVFGKEEYKEISMKVIDAYNMTEKEFQNMQKNLNMTEKKSEEAIKKAELSIKKRLKKNYDKNDSKTEKKELKALKREEKKRRNEVDKKVSSGVSKLCNGLKELTKGTAKFVIKHPFVTLAAILSVHSFYINKKNGTESKAVTFVKNYKAETDKNLKNKTPNSSIENLYKAGKTTFGNISKDSGDNGNKERDMTYWRNMAKTLSKKLSNLDKQVKSGNMTQEEENEARQKIRDNYKKYKTAVNHVSKERQKIVKKVAGKPKNILNMQSKNSNIKGSNILKKFLTKEAADELLDELYEEIYS